MNDFGIGQQLPEIPPASKKAFPIGPIILGVVGLLIALAIIGGWKAFHAVKKGSAEAITVGNSFIDNLGQHNYSAAHSLFTPPVQANTPAGNLKDIEVLVEKHHGAFINHGQPQWNIQNWNGQTSVRLAYPVQFTKSSSLVSMTLLETDQGYRVYEVHYEF